MFKEVFNLIISDLVDQWRSKAEVTGEDSVGLNRSLPYPAPLSHSLFWALLIKTCLMPRAKSNKNALSCIFSNKQLIINGRLKFLEIKKQP